MNRRYARATTLLAAPFALGLALMTAPVQATVAAGDSVASSASTEQMARGKKGKKPKRFCMGKRATIVGNKKANRIIGTSGRDVIWAGGGADSVVSLGGRDRVCGGRGGDALIGGPGRDRLHGGKQSDFCWGEPREHRYHFKCDAHLDLNGVPTSKPPRPGGAGNANQAVPAPAQHSSAQQPSAQATSGAYFNFDQPVCGANYPFSMVYLGNVYFNTWYTNPGWIAVRPVYARFSKNTGWATSTWNYEGSSYTLTDGWKLISAPADGTTYQFPLQPIQTANRGNDILVAYETYWWNGYAWVDGRLTVAEQTHLQTNTGLVPTGPLCWI